MRELCWAGMLAMLVVSAGPPAAAATFPTEGKGIALQENKSKACGTVSGTQPCFVRFSKVPSGKILRVDRVDCASFGSNAGDVFAIWLEKPVNDVPLQSFVGIFTGDEGSATTGGPYFFANGQFPHIQGGGTDTTLVCTLAGFLFDAAPQ